MKRFLVSFLLFVCATVSAQTINTPNIGLQMPAAGSTNWNLPLNYNFNLLDQLIGATLQSVGVGLSLKPVFGTGMPTLVCSTTNQGQQYFDTSTTPFTGYVCNNLAWGGTGQASTGGPFPNGAIVYGLTNTTARPATAADVLTLFSSLSGCGTANYVISPANGNCILNGSGGVPTLTANEGVGVDSAGALQPLPEINFSTSSGLTSIMCQEDHNAGIWDVRCNRGGVNWFTNPSTALVNTYTAAKCYEAANDQIPTIKIPSGGFNIGGNINIPPNMTITGPEGSEYGQYVNLNTTDPTQPMFTTVSSSTLTCPSGSQTFTGNGATIEYVSLVGGGSANPLDHGIVNASGGSYTSHVSFSNFGGEGRINSGEAINSRGDYLWFQHNLQWYYFSGSYNPSSFADNTYHCSLLLGDLDGHWDHIEGYGELGDSGFYNRYLLGNVCLGGGQGTWLKDSFIQIAPHNVIILDGSDGSELVTGNRLDDGWWSSIYVGEGATGNISENAINGWCTSSTLNPANFSTNPGGVTTDPNCSAIELNDGALGSNLLYNKYSEDNGVWPSWPVGTIYTPLNVIAAQPTHIVEPSLGVGQIIGQVGGNASNGNPGADVTGSLNNITWVQNLNTGPTLHFNNYLHLALYDSATTNYTTFDGLYPDLFVTVFLESTYDTITPSSTIITCNNATLTGISGPYNFWTNTDGVLTETGCVTTTATVPTPTLTAIGGIKAINAVTNEFISSIDTSGNPILSALPAYPVGSNTVKGILQCGYGVNCNLTAGTIELGGFLNNSLAVGSTGSTNGTIVSYGNTGIVIIATSTTGLFSTDALISFEPNNTTTASNWYLGESGNITSGGSDTAINGFYLEQSDSSGTSHMGAFTVNNFMGGSGGTIPVGWIGLASNAGYCWTSQPLHPSYAAAPQSCLWQPASGVISVGNSSLNNSSGTMVAEHFVGGGTQPTATTTAGSGTGASVSVTTGSTDTSGQVTLTTGSSPAPTAAMVLLTFAAPYTQTANCTISPSNETASALYGAQAVWISNTTTTLNINSGATALAASSTYDWKYVCFGSHY